jgi:hypothetical protein
MIHMNKQEVLEKVDAALAALQGLEHALYNDDPDAAKAELLNTRRELLQLYLMIAREKES